MTRTYSSGYVIPDPRDEPPKQWQCPECLRVWECDGEEVCCREEKDEDDE